MDLHGTAHAFAAAGISVVPTRPDGTKAPAAFWKQYQLRRATPDEIDSWLTGDTYDGIGLVCGTVSGNLEMLELEGRAVAENYVQQLQAALDAHRLSDLWAKLNTGYLEVTPSRGLHWLYRVDGPARPNLKLARRPATATELADKPTERVKVLIETRGEGGYVVVAPSAGRTHETGNAWVVAAGGITTIPTLSEDERDTLHAIAQTLDQMPADEPERHATAAATARTGTRPGDDFNSRTDWKDILTGWTKVRAIGTGAGWRRPGKDRGISATTGTSADGADRLYVFSTSTEFETEKPYSKFGAYALLCHGGDHSAAARHLHRLGYGDQKTATERADMAALIGTLPATTTTDGALAVVTPLRLDPGRKVVLTKAADIRPKPVRWLWSRRLALGSLALLAGRGGLGKSTIAYWLAARITRGSLEGEAHGTPRAVLVAAAEDSWEHTIVPRLIAANADLQLVYRVEVQTFEDVTSAITFPKDNAEVERAVQDTSAALILLDPLMSRIGGDLDTHRDAEVRQALEPLVSIADRAAAVVLGLIHVNKSGKNDAVNAVMGSAAFANVARAILMTVPSLEDDGTSLFGQPKNNLGRTDLPSLRYRIASTSIQTDEGPTDVGRVEWLEEVDTTMDEAIRAGAIDPEERLAAKDAQAWLVSYLMEHGGSAPSDDIIFAGDRAGHAKRTLQRARSNAKITYEFAGFPKRSVWSLPFQSPSGPTTEDREPLSDEARDAGGSSLHGTARVAQPDEGGDHVGGQSRLPIGEQVADGGSQIGVGGDVTHGAETSRSSDAKSSQVATRARAQGETPPIGTTTPDLHFHDDRVARLMAPLKDPNLGGASVAPRREPPRARAREDGATLPPGAYGPCVECGHQTHRYGPGGKARCPDCQDKP